MSENILIIKHGALGDWILATGAFRLIREHHPKAKIVLITASSYVALAKQSHCFDEVWVDDRKGILDSLKLILKIRKEQFHRIYDLQRSQRTRFYFQAIQNSRLFWSGHIKKAQGYFIDDLQKHIVERIALQLQSCEINSFPTPDISWLKADITAVKPNPPYALVIAGCAKHRPKKRWTAQAYAEVIEWLAQKNIQTLLIGTTVDREIVEAIMNLISHAKPINLLNKTSYAELAELARSAVFTLGSDTGSMHIAASAGCPSLTLFCNSESSPQFNRPWGAKAKTIAVANLQDLPASELIKAYLPLLLRAEL